LRYARHVTELIAPKLLPHHAAPFHGSRRRCCSRCVAKLDSLAYAAAGAMPPPVEAIVEAIECHATGIDLSGLVNGDDRFR
jgi:hypothetical protein